MHVDDPGFWFLVFLFLFFPRRATEEGAVRSGGVLVSECSNDLPGLATTEAQLRWIFMHTRMSHTWGMVDGSRQRYEPRWQGGVVMSVGWVLG